MQVPVRVKILPHGEGLELPAYQTAGAAGADLHAAVTDPVVLQPGERALIPCGFAIALPAGWEMQVRPRSGLAVRHGVTVLNAPGTIDCDYRGELMVPMVNFGQEPYAIERGTRIAQCLLAKVHRVDWEIVEGFEATPRGERGFGSTG